jgi:hypothetical protein
MGGFGADKARLRFNIPANYEHVAAIASAISATLKPFLKHYSSKNLPLKLVNKIG